MIKPCPNCGGFPKMNRKKDKIWFECDGNCWTQTGKYYFYEDALKEWNSIKKREEELIWRGE